MHHIQSWRLEEKSSQWTWNWIRYCKINSLNFSLNTPPHAFVGHMRGLWHFQYVQHTVQPGYSITNSVGSDFKTRKCRWARHFLAAYLLVRAQLCSQFLQLIVETRISNLLIVKMSDWATLWIADVTSFCQHLPSSPIASKYSFCFSVWMAFSSFFVKLL